MNEGSDEPTLTTACHSLPSTQGAGDGSLFTLVVRKRANAMMEERRLCKWQLFQTLASIRVCPCIFPGSSLKRDWSNSLWTESLLYAAPLGVPWPRAPGFPMQLECRQSKAVGVSLQFDPFFGSAICLVVCPGPQVFWLPEAQEI